MSWLAWAFAAWCIASLPVALRLGPVLARNGSAPAWKARQDAGHNLPDLHELGGVPPQRRVYPAPPRAAGSSAAPHHPRGRRPSIVVGA